jgi:predicted heme/steroid binding protein
VDNKHDYKAVLENLPKNNTPQMTIACWFDRNEQTIKSALRIAVKLQSGDVSDEAASNGLHAAIKDYGTDVTDEYKAAFKAMAAQVMEEVEDE